MQQHVIFLGKGEVRMPTAIREQNLTFHYNLLNISEVNYKIFLRSRRPEEKILAILANFESDPPELVARHICRELDRCVPNALDAGRYFRQLCILAQLRNLNLNFLDNMESIASFFSEEKDIFYIRGMQKGMEEGIEKGIEKERVNIAIELKKEGLPVEYIARVTKLGVEEIEKL